MFIHTITDEQWAAIRKLAIQINDSGRHNGDQMRAAIEAFILWLTTQTDQLTVEVTEDQVRH